MTMTMTDEQFMASFEDASLSSDAFHHEGHVRMAFLYLSRYPALEALQRFSGSLARLAAVRGKLVVQVFEIYVGFVIVGSLRDHILLDGMILPNKHDCKSQRNCRSFQ